MISGYVREAQLLFKNKDHPYYNIPFEIAHICVRFYYLIIGWDSDKCGQGLTISGLDGNIVTVDTYDMSAGYTVYHDKWYHSQLEGFVRFKAKVNKLDDDQDLYIGFASFDDIVNNGFYTVLPPRISYALQGDADLWIGNSGVSAKPVMDNAECIEEQDIIELILHLTELKILFCKNGGEKRVIFQGIESGSDIRYKFAVTFYFANVEDSVTILEVEDCTCEK